MESKLIIWNQHSKWVYFVPSRKQGQMDLSLAEKIYDHPLLKKEDYKEIAKAHTRIEFRQGDMLLEIGRTASEFYIRGKRRLGKAGCGKAWCWRHPGVL